jgi:hypothetical protein
MTADDDWDWDQGVPAEYAPLLRASHPRVAWASSICCRLSYDAFGSKPKSSLVIGQNRLPESMHVRISN